MLVLLVGNKLSLDALQDSTDIGNEPLRDIFMSITAKTISVQSQESIERVGLHIIIYSVACFPCLSKKIVLQYTYLLYNMTLSVSQFGVHFIHFLPRFIGLCLSTVYLTPSNGITKFWRLLVSKVFLLAAISNAARALAACRPCGGWRKNPLQSHYRLGQACLAAALLEPPGQPVQDSDKVKS